MRKNLFVLFLCATTLPAFGVQVDSNTQIEWNSGVVVGAVKSTGSESAINNKILVDLLDRNQFSVLDAVSVCKTYCNQSKNLNLYSTNIDCPAFCEKFGNGLVTENNKRASILRQNTVTSSGVRTSNEENSVAESQITKELLQECISSLKNILNTTDINFDEIQRLKEDKLYVVLFENKQQDLQDLYSLKNYHSELPNDDNLEVMWHSCSRITTYVKSNTLSDIQKTYDVLNDFFDTKNKYKYQKTKVSNKYEAEEVIVKDVFNELPKYADNLAYINEYNLECSPNSSGNGFICGCGPLTAEFVFDIGDQGIQTSGVEKDSGTKVADKAFTEEADGKLRTILYRCNNMIEREYDKNVNSDFGMDKIKQNPLFSMVTDEIKHKFDHYLESHASGEQVCKKIADKTFNEDEIDGMLEILMTLSIEDTDVFLMLLDIKSLFNTYIELAFEHYSLDDDSVSTQVSSLQEAENWVRNRIKALLGDKNKLKDGTEIIDLSHLKCTGKCNWIPGSQDYVTCTLGPLQKTLEFDDICNH